MWLLITDNLAILFEPSSEVRGPQTPTALLSLMSKRYDKALYQAITVSLQANDATPPKVRLAPHHHPGIVEPQACPAVSGSS